MSSQKLAFHVIPPTLLLFLRMFEVHQAVSVIIIENSKDGSIHLAFATSYIVLPWPIKMLPGFFSERYLSKEVSHGDDIHE
jgi:hypothetical protein